jgi:hypothetical protein
MTQPDDYIYDEEVYPNCFLFGAKHKKTGTRYVFEISFRRDDRAALFAWCEYLRENNGRVVGYNNIGYDYPVLHTILTNIEYVTNSDIYAKSCSIFARQDSDDKFANMLWESDWLIKQLDLLKVHHFDNQAKRTSLKQLEFAMRMDTIEDLPYVPGTYLTSEQIDHLRNYMFHDIDATDDFHGHSKEELDFRTELSAEFEKNLMNYSDTNIGKEFFIEELKKAGVINIKKGGTPRHQLDLGSLLLPSIRFETESLIHTHAWISSQTITETKGVFKNLIARVAGFDFVFGLGGIHGSVESRHVKSTDQYVIMDDDVESYYPKLAITQRWYPEHLGPIFCDVYEHLFELRKTFAKGTSKNKMVKLGLNGTYGNSNSKYSPFFDPAFTMKITLNGQLLLCMLAEQLVKVPGLMLIQANTDGLTYYVPRVFLPQVEAIRQWWMEFTKLKLEQNEYSDMWIRDVNSYIARYAKTGELKRKGAYGYGKDLGWHQNHSMQVVARAAEAALVHGKDIGEFIRSHEDFHDFMMLAKVPKTNRLYVGDRQVQNVTRYYVATDGEPMQKIMPPLPKKPGVERPQAICKGYVVHECNNIAKARRDNLNYDFYITEAEKLVKPLQ